MAAQRVDKWCSRMWSGSSSRTQSYGNGQEPMATNCGRGTGHLWVLSPW